MIKMKAGLILPIALLALLLLYSTSIAGGFNLAGVGAKALSMSGSFRAIADDWSAMYWNPAGLAGQESGVWLEAKLLYPMAWATPNASPTTINPDHDVYRLYRNGIKQSSDEAAFPSGALAFQWKFNEKLTAGISAYAPSAIGLDWTEFYLGPYESYDENPAYPDIAWSSDMKVLDVHPTVAYKVTDKFKVGLGIALKYAMIKLQSPKLVPSNDGTGARLPMPAQDFFVDAVLDGDGMGFSFNIGLLYDVTDNFHVGFCYTGPATIALEGTVKQTLYMPTMAGAGMVEVEPDAKADFPIPMEYGLGLAYDFNERLTIAGDLSFVNWKALDQIEIELTGDGLDGGPAENSTLDLQWKNTLRFNIGANYLLVPEKGMELRLGYYFEPTPIPVETVRPTITDVTDKHNFSIGTMLPITSKIFVDAYWEHVWSADRAVSAFDNDGDGMFDNVPGDWKMQVDTFGCQFGYRF